MGISFLPDYHVDIIKSSLGREINKLIISEFVTIANNYNLKINLVSYFISRPKESRFIENEILLVLTRIASSTIAVCRGEGDKTRTIPLARAQKESLTIRLEVRED